MIIIKKFSICALLIPMFAYAFEQKTVDDIFQQHCASLKNTNVAQQKFVIMFSGTPGMGKSFIAKILEENYQAVRINTDEMRALLQSSPIERREYEDFLNHYFAYFFEHYSASNKCFILDCSIDRRYTQLFPFFKSKNIPFIVIRLEVPYDTILARIQEREGDNASSYLKYLDTWLADYTKFGQEFTESYCLKHDDHIPYDGLFAAINEKRSMNNTTPS